MINHQQLYCRVGCRGELISFTLWPAQIPVPDHSCAAFAAFLHYLYYDQLPHLDASDNGFLLHAY
jgi:hypothetical protein